MTAITPLQASEEDPEGPANCNRTIEACVEECTDCAAWCGNVAVHKMVCALDQGICFMGDELCSVPTRPDYNFCSCKNP